MKCVVKQMVWTVLIVLVGWVTKASATPIVQDTFNRDNNYVLGTMSDGVHSWVEADEPGDAMVNIQSSRMYVNSTSPSPYTFGASVSGFQPINGVIEVDVVSAAYWSFINYRAASNSQASTYLAGNVYRVSIFGNAIKLFYGDVGGTPLASYTSTTGNDGTYKITFDGNHHVVQRNGTTIMDYTDTTPGRDVAGYVGLGTYYSVNAQFDNFNVSAVPEPATIGFLLASFGLWATKRKHIRE